MKLGYSKEDQLRDNRPKRESTFGKKRYDWKNKSRSKPNRIKEVDIVDSNYSKWLGTQKCVITEKYATRGSGANDMHCHHIYGRNPSRNDYKQVPLMGYVHSWGDKSYHSMTKEDFKNYHNVMVDDLIEYFEEMAEYYLNKYVKNGGIIHKN